VVLSQQGDTYYYYYHQSTEDYRAHHITPHYTAYPPITKQRSTLQEKKSNCSNDEVATTI